MGYWLLCIVLWIASMCMTHMMSGVCLKYLYNNSFYIQQTVIIYLMVSARVLARARVCATRLYGFRGENVCGVYALALLWQMFVHSVPIYVLRHHRNDYIHFSFSFMQDSSAEVRRKYWNNISMDIVFLHCVRKPAFDFVVGKWDEIDTMQCAWFFFFLCAFVSLLALLLLLLMHAACCRCRRK